MTAQERPVNGPGDVARSRQVEGAESEPNPSVDDIPAETLARIRAGVMAEIRRPGYVRIAGTGYANSYAPSGRMIEIGYGYRCTLCWDRGHLPRKRDPYAYPPHDEWRPGEPCDCTSGESPW